MKSQVKSEMPPPPQAATDFKTRRSNFVRKILYNEDKSVSFISDSEIFGWNLEGNLYEAGLTCLARRPDIYILGKKCLNLQIHNCTKKKNY